MLIKSQVKELKEFFKEILIQRQRGYPMFFIRFEDLKSDPYPILKSLFKFLLDVDDISGTVLEKRIE